MKQQTRMILVSVDWELEWLSLVVWTQSLKRLPSGCQADSGHLQCPWGRMISNSLMWTPPQSFLLGSLREGGGERRRETERAHTHPGEKPQLFCRWILEMTPHHSVCSAHQRQVSLFSPHTTGGPYMGAGEQGSPAASETTDHATKSGSMKEGTTPHTAT